MEASDYLSLHSDDERGIEKAFCCLQASTLDFVKYARLICTMEIGKKNRLFRQIGNPALQNPIQKEITNIFTTIPGE
ncbi:MAG: hypothetical protein CL868_15680 [Cytophagaceae bacterium]|nr:hypothetical protein [Cytophagaceae bacterium]